MYSNVYGGVPDFEVSDSSEKKKVKYYERIKEIIHYTLRGII